MVGFVMLATSMAATASANESIIGVWRHVDGHCTLADGALVVEPLGLHDHDIVCSFASVIRRGDVVTWDGRCGSYDGPTGPSTVVAKLRVGRLSLAVDGKPWPGILLRCTGNRLTDK